MTSYTVSSPEVIGMYDELAGIFGWVPTGGSST